MGLLTSEVGQLTSSMLEQLPGLAAVGATAGQLVEVGEVPLRTPEDGSRSCHSPEPSDEIPALRAPFLGGHPKFSARDLFPKGLRFGRMRAVDPGPGLAIPTLATGGMDFTETSSPEGAAILCCESVSDHPLIAQSE